MPNFLTPYSKAIDYLSRREHSRFELRQKLLRKYNKDEVEAVLTDLISKNLQSDARFTESYVEMRKKVGFGPIRIKVELQQRGISEALIEEYVKDHSLDWEKSMRVVWKKKFLKSPKSLEQQFRFLAYRGYNSEDIWKFLRG